MSLSPSRNFYKNLSTSNPILSNIFCADPTGIEYNGRLYVYGTNDHQQFEEEGIYGKNSYNGIKSLVCFSTDDLQNWTYHGKIDVDSIAPWIMNSWAPSIISRKEKDGLDHFYLYFSNNGCGVGVITSTSPLGPWNDPLGKPLINFDLDGLNGCPNPFDPGVCLDDKGIAYLSFGAGVAPYGNDYLPGTSRIIKLGEDLISIDSEIKPIPAPYFFEASELNFINGTYVYTYNNSWGERKEWDYDCEKPTACSMSYMVSKTPLEPESWKYCNHYFKNPGEQGLNYSNNHTHLVKFKNQWYILYHTLTLQENTDATGGFRSICIDKAEVSEDEILINLSNGTRKGLDKIADIDPFKDIIGTTIFTSAEIGFKNEDNPMEIAAVSKEEGAWILVKNVDFSIGTKVITADLTGEGFIEVRLDKLSQKAAGIINSNNSKESETSSAIFEVEGVHDVYLIFSNKDLILKKWSVK